MSESITISSTVRVSDGSRTIQAFDFIAKVLEDFINYNDVDRLMLCQLLITLAQTKQVTVLKPEDPTKEIIHKLNKAAEHGR